MNLFLLLLFWDICLIRKIDHKLFIINFGKFMISLCEWIMWSNNKCFRTSNNSRPCIDDVDNEHALISTIGRINCEEYLIVDLGSAESIAMKGSIDFQVESFPDGRKEERGDEPTCWSPGYFISWVKCRRERTTRWSSQWALNGSIWPNGRSMKFPLTGNRVDSLTVRPPSRDAPSSSWNSMYRLRDAFFSALLKSPGSKGPLIS